MDLQLSVSMKIWNIVRATWERVLFASIGLVCFGFSIRNIIRDDMTGAATTFGIGFFCFLYSNVSRFKRFKGLGFEAELWEDKQKEAASLIERLKGVVSVYTREIVMARVMSGRWGGGSTWPDRWSLFDELTTRHDELGQTLDFAPLKRRMDEILIFDVTNALSSKLEKQIREANQKISSQIRTKYGSPITDSDAYGKEVALLRSVQLKEEDLFERSKTENIAQTIIESALAAQHAAKSSFDFGFELDEGALADLQYFSDRYKSRPFVITSDLKSKVESVMTDAH